jgi:hypothetical protein
MPFFPVQVYLYPIVFHGAFSLPLNTHTDVEISFPSTEVTQTIGECLRRSAHCNVRQKYEIR